MADDPDQRSQKQGTTATTPGADGASTNSSSVSSPPDSPALEAAAPTNGFIFTGSSYSGMNVESTAVAATPAATSVSASTGSQGVVFVAGPGTGPAATNTTMAVAPMPTATSVLVPAAQSPSSGPDTPDSSIVEEVDSKFALNNELNKTCNEKSFREGMDVTGPQYRDMNQNAVAIWDEYYTNAPAVYDRRFAETTLIVELLWRCKWLYDAYLAVIEGGHPEWANRALNWRFWRIYRNVRNSVRTRETTDNLEQRDKTGRGNQIDGHHFDYCKEDLLKEYWTNEPEDPLNLGSIQRQAQPDHSTTASAKRDRAIAGAPRARTAAPRPAQSSLTAAPSFAERLPSVRQMLQSDNIKQGGRQRANGSNLASSFNGFKNDSGVTTDEVDAPMSGVGDDRAAPAALPDAEPPMPPNGSTHVDATAGPEREEHKVTGQETSAPQGSREVSRLDSTLSLETFKTNSNRLRRFLIPPHPRSRRQRLRLSIAIARLSLMPLLLLPTLPPR